MLRKIECNVCMIQDIACCDSGQCCFPSLENPEKAADISYCLRCWLAVVVLFLCFISAYVTKTLVSQAKLKFESNINAVYQYNNHASRILDEIISFQHIPQDNCEITETIRLLFATSICTFTF